MALNPRHGVLAGYLCEFCPTCVVRVTCGEPEPIFSALTPKWSVPLCRPETFSTVKVELLVVVTFSFDGLRWTREATARTPWGPTNRRPVSLNLSSGLAQVRVIWIDLVAAAIARLCSLLWPCLRMSLKVRGGVWQVSAAPTSFITACSWLESDNPKYLPPVSLAIFSNRCLSVTEEMPTPNPIT